MSACMWGVHGADKVKWILTGVPVGNDVVNIRDDMRVFINVAWGVGVSDGCWVENGKSQYVIVRWMPEDELGRKGVKWLKECNARIVWGHRNPAVVMRAWGEVPVKVEAATVDDACMLVRDRTKWGDRRLFTEMGVGRGGTGVKRIGEEQRAPLTGQEGRRGAAGLG